MGMLFINTGSRKRERCIRNKDVCRNKHKIFLYPCEDNYQEGTAVNIFLKFWSIGCVINYFPNPL